MKGLFKRGQTWWMRFTFEGKQLRRSTKTGDKKLAERIYRKVMGEIAEGKWFEKPAGANRTFRDLMTKYLDEYSARNKAPKTYIRDLSLASHLLGEFEDLTLAEITPSLISEYKTKRRNEGASPKTINNELVLMGHAYRLACGEWEWASSNPVSNVSKEKCKNTIERWLTVDEEKLLLAASPKWLQEIIVFAIATGLRQGEILSLRWSQVDLFQKTIAILEQKNKDRDTLPLNKKALKVLTARAKVRSLQCDNVFFNGAGKPIDARNLLRAFYVAVKKANITRLRFHDLRHTFATRLVQRKVDIYAVQKLGRWKSITMVERYGHHYSESLRPGIEALDQEESSANLAQSNEKGVTPETQPLDMIGSGG